MIKALDSTDMDWAGWTFPEYSSVFLRKTFTKAESNRDAPCEEVKNIRSSAVKAMDEGGPKKPFPSEPLITLQYETSLYKV